MKTFFNCRSVFFSLTSIRVCFYLFKVAIDNVCVGFRLNACMRSKKRMINEMHVRHGLSIFKYTQVHLTMSVGTHVSQMLADEFVSIYH